jgi:hypothetical protein
MHYRPCDQLGADLLEAQEFWHCTLSVPVAERLIEFVSGKYPTDDFEILLEQALDREFVLIEDERHAYKKVLGHFFTRRAQAARTRRKEMLAIPFAPQGPDA